MKNESLIPKAQRILGYECVSCEYRLAYEPQPYTCAKCGGILDVLWDNEQLRQSFTREMLRSRSLRNVWRYRELLPVEQSAHLTPLRVGCTPQYSVPTLRKTLGFDHLWIKDDGLNPTASYKDRASAIGVAAALDSGYSIGACASTGNAASSFAGIGASLGLRTVIFVPQSAPVAKVTQLLMYGSRVFSVQGSYDQTFDLATEAIETYGWYNRNAALNPFLVEGKKTAAFEIAEDFEFSVPDVCVVAVGDGCIIGSLYKGFNQLLELGLTSRIPRLIGVQSERADALVQAFESESTPQNANATSYADSINVGMPRNGVRALKSVRRSAGAFVRVRDEDIQEAQKRLAQESGIFGEPAGVASLAGLLEARKQELVASNERIVVLMTGNGLKDVEGARQAVGQVDEVSPDLGALRGLLE